MPIAAPTMPDSLIGVSKQRLLPNFACRPFGATEHAAEVADVLAEHDDRVVAFHCHVMRVADRLDHRLARHRSGSRRHVAGGRRGRCGSGMGTPGSTIAGTLSAHSRTSSKAPGLAHVPGCGGIHAFSHLRQGCPGKNVKCGRAIVLAPSLSSRAKRSVIEGPASPADVA